MKSYNVKEAPIQQKRIPIIVGEEKYVISSSKENGDNSLICNQDINDTPISLNKDK